MERKRGRRLIAEPFHAAHTQTPYGWEQDVTAVMRGLSLGKRIFPSQINIWGSWL